MSDCTPADLGLTVNPTTQETNDPVVAMASADTDPLGSQVSAGSG